MVSDFRLVNDTALTAPAMAPDAWKHNGTDISIFSHGGYVFCRLLFGPCRNTRVNIKSDIDAAHTKSWPRLQSAISASQCLEGSHKMFARRFATFVREQAIENAIRTRLKLSRETLPWLRMRRLPESLPELTPNGHTATFAW